MSDTLYQHFILLSLGIIGSGVIALMLNFRMIYLTYMFRKYNGSLLHYSKVDKIIELKMIKSQLVFLLKRVQLCKNSLMCVLISITLLIISLTMGLIGFYFQFFNIISGFSVILAFLALTSGLIIATIEISSLITPIIEEMKVIDLLIFKKVK